MAIKKKPSAKPSAAKKPAKQDTPPDPLLGKRAPKLPGAGPGAGGPYVLYFYPKDDTPGCTKEACDFRDGLSAFRKAGVRVIGVSPDSEASHARFSEKYALPFTLLSDPDKQLARAYSVWVKKKNYGREYMGIERSTFLVDAKGVVRRVWRGVKVAGHVDSVLAAAKEL
ncbi:MAG: peroxiredoxin [Polyangiaceae bacterium]